MAMANFLKTFFKDPDAGNSKLGKRKREALTEDSNKCSPAAGARLLECVLIVQKPSTTATPHESHPKAPRKASAKTPKQTSSQTLSGKMNVPIRKSGRPARRTHVATYNFDDASDEEMHSDFEIYGSTEPDEDFEDPMSDSDDPISDSDDPMSDSDDPMSDAKSEVSDIATVRSSSAPLDPQSEEGLDGAVAEPVAKKKKPNKPSPNLSGAKPRISKRDLDLNLPPLTHIQDIFLDITKKALEKGFDQVIDFLKGGDLKVGTMCSGTESPLLALRLVQQCLQDDLNTVALGVDHVFSAEIEAFKQAYIERNFHPNLLFRDITELYIDDDKKMKGITAYGAQVDVPRDIHILIAGSSCVDFSTLNSAQVNGFGEREGESEDTFMAVLKYAEWARPPIVILENVDKDEAWKEFKRHFDRIGYATEAVKVDTKDYYLPQTRQRRYMLCLDTKVYKKAERQELPKWRELMVDFKRRASSALPTFLLSADDPRHIALLARIQSSSRDTGGSNTSWEACRGRHLAVRLEDRLGTRKPVMLILPEHCDAKWVRRRVDREIDVIEICHLKRAKELIDSQFKTRVIDLSQNIERVDNAPLGISGCLTPSGIPYLTDRSGPVTGLHALQLQGIPIDELIFTSETDAELRDLAGNAMSSTIVGSAIISALIVAAKSLHVAKSAASTSFASTPLKADKMIDNDLEKVSIESVTKIQLAGEMLKDAHNSARRCPCEAQTLVSNYDIRVCRSCGHTACQKCAGNPAHDYDTLIRRSTRLTPHKFASKWRSSFPMRIRLQAPLQSLEEMESSMDSDVSKQYLLAVQQASKEGLVFKEFHRSEHWHVRYESAHAVLELKLSNNPEWRLFVKPSPELSANSKLRRILGRPIAHSMGDVTLGNTEINLTWWVPSTSETRLSIAGRDKQPSWRAKLGLPDYANETVFSVLDIHVHDSSALHVDLDGQYKLLSGCGTAYSSLHKRIANKTSVGKDMFFFMDPNPIGLPVDDQYVFSSDHERQHDPLQTREVFARIDSSWRAWDKEMREDIRVHQQGFWTKPTKARLEVIPSNIEYYRPNLNNLCLTGPQNQYSCQDIQTVLKARFDAPTDIRRSWINERLVATNDRYFYDQFAWPLRNGRVLASLVEWMSIDCSSFEKNCETCSPSPPAIRWRPDLARTSKKDARTTVKLVVQEDRLAAAAYERSLKSRPSPYTIVTKIDAASFAEVKIGVNILSLAHRAIAKLRLATSLTPRVNWRLDSNYVERVVVKFPRFFLQSNNADVPHPQIDGMKLALKPQQLRSLTWMRAQEAKAGVSFECQEIEEAVLPKLGWKVEARATAQTRVKGGVLADQPSYGKTVTSLALIHAGFADEQEDCSEGDKVRLKATLIVTPSHLIDQWRDEISKFLPDEYDQPGVVLVINTVADWKKYSLLQFMKAKIVILSWLVLIRAPHVGQLALFTALPQPNLAGREFKTWLEHAVASIPPAIAELKRTNNIVSFAKERAKLFASNCKDAQFQAVIPSRRVKGAKYVASKANKDKKALPLNDNEFEQPEGTLKMAPGNTSVGWKGLAHPPFHLFCWNRLLIDEYTTLDTTLPGDKTAAYASVLQLKADKRWILSGTPALNDFVDVKAMAGLLGIHLGIDAFVPDLLGARKLKSLRDDLSRSELFQSFQELHSSDWHQYRHTQAQKFLNTFVRQNDAEIGHIQTLSRLNTVRLTPAHRAVYEELSQYLQAADMNVRESAHHGSDREAKINQSLNEAKDAEGALVRSTAAFAASGGSDSFEDLILLRQGQLKSLKVDLRELLRLAQYLKQQKDDEAKERLSKWRTEPVDDIQAEAIINKYAREAEESKKDLRYKIKANEVLPKMKDTILKLRPHARELTSRIRSLRFVQAIRSVQNSPGSAECEKCKSSFFPSDLRLLSTCGHIICVSCLENSPSADFCLVDGCEAELDQRCVKSVQDYLDSDDSPPGPSFGAKLDTIARILKALPPDDQAILFVPGWGLMNDAADCFEHHEIPHVALYNERDDVDKVDKKRVGINQEKMKSFKEKKTVEERDRVLIMNLDSDHITGLNLTNANHVMFLSPLHAQDQYGYDSRMLQAIRRAHRFGQEKLVHIYRFVALKTIDVNILENRERSLPEPLWENPDTPIQLSTTHHIEQKTELAELVSVGRKMALAPKTWVAKHKVDVAPERFSADVQLSNAYEELDEEDSIDE